MANSDKKSLTATPVVSTVLIVGQDRTLRQQVSQSLGAHGHRLLVADAGHEALRLSREFKQPIHLLVANIEMPDMTGIELAQRLNEHRPETKALFVSNLKTGVLVLDAGWQYLPAAAAPNLLVNKLREILRESGHSRVQLTKREMQVLKLIAAGESTKAAAAVLGIAFKTCVAHRSSLMKKLGIHDSVTLAHYAIRAGLIDT